MNWQEYVKAARRTQPKNLEPIYPIIALYGETGEWVELIKKLVNHGWDRDKVLPDLIIEAGDVAWYTVALVDAVMSLFDSSERAEHFSGTLLAMERLGSDCPIDIFTGDGNHMVSCLFVGKLVGDICGRALDLFPPANENLIDVANIASMVMSQVIHTTWVISGEPADYLVSRIFDSNITKLNRRYPDGFSQERSRNRDE